MRWALEGPVFGRDAEVSGGRRWDAHARRIVRVQPVGPIAGFRLLRRRLRERRKVWLTANALWTAMRSFVDSSAKSCLATDWLIRARWRICQAVHRLRP